MYYISIIDDMREKIKAHAIMLHIYNTNFDFKQFYYLFDDKNRVIASTYRLHDWDYPTKTISEFLSIIPDKNTFTDMIKFIDTQLQLVFDGLVYYHGEKAIQEIPYVGDQFLRIQKSRHELEFIKNFFEFEEKKIISSFTENNCSNKKNKLKIRKLEID